MANNPFEKIRLSVMMDYLPVGMAVLDRAVNGGVNKVKEVFTSSRDPLQELREEGEEAASDLREQLDILSPGLGNPIEPVKVEVDADYSIVEEPLDEESLMNCLARIEARLYELEEHFPNSFESISNSPVEEG